MTNRDRQIDRLVYQLYDLTDAEIALVEGVPDMSLRAKYAKQSPTNDRQVNQLVYQLYGLTEKNLALVVGSI